MLTPFDAEGRINESVLRDMVDFCIEAGISGLFPVSSSGEFVHLSLEENCRLMDIVVDQARGRLPVTPGVSTSCADNSIHLAKHAQALGCPAVVVCPPYYYPVSQEVIESHFAAIAKAVDIPLIIYNIPAFTTPISYELAARLSNDLPVVGMKDSSGSMADFVQFMEQVRQTGADISFMCGREEILLPALAIGGQGCMVVSAGIVPEILMEIYQLCEAGEYHRAREVQFALLRFLQTANRLPFPSGFKLALELRGFPMGAFKQPLPTSSQQEVEEIKAELKHAMEEMLEPRGLQLVVNR